MKIRINEYGFGLSPPLFIHQIQTQHHWFPKTLVYLYYIPSSPYFSLVKSCLPPFFFFFFCSLRILLFVQDFSDPYPLSTTPSSILIYSRSILFVTSSPYQFISLYYIFINHACMHDYANYELMAPRGEGRVVGFKSIVGNIFKFSSFSDTWFE